MKVAVIGSRTFTNYNLLFKILDRLNTTRKITCIVSGGAKGADALAEQWARTNDVPLDIYPADWDKYGKGAGFIRNKEIWDNADTGVAFWDGVSKGTQHSFDIAKKQGKKLLVVNYINNTKFVIG